MPAFSATSPGKIILFGEHAVVYGEPAIAVPVSGLQARTVISAVIPGKSGEIWIEAPDISLSSPLADLDREHPLRAAILAVVGESGIEKTPACRIQVTSTIPQASGLGSSAAISTSMIRALSAFLGKRLSDEEVSRAGFEVEKIHHGTPSGIDNNVVAFRQPVYYQTGHPLEFLKIGSPFSILIAGSGSPGHTREAVASIREKQQEHPGQINPILSRIGDITRQARELIGSGKIAPLGPLMNLNHTLLQDLGVSTPALDRLVQTARNAGALGAKLSGGGLGGYLIALVEENTDPIYQALMNDGAQDVFLSRIEKAPHTPAAD